MVNRQTEPKTRTRYRRTPCLSLLICVCGVVLPFLLLTPTGAVGSENLLEQLNELAEGTELAIYLSQAAIVAVSEQGSLVNLDALARMLDRGRDAFAGQASLFMLADRVEASLERVALSTYVEIDLERAMQTVFDYLLLAEAEVSGALNSADTYTISAKRAYAYLLAALGSDDSGLGLDGIRQMIRSLPDSEVRVSPGEDIQEAVDRVLPGGTIYLSPGDYELSNLTISKSLSLGRIPGSAGVVTLRGAPGEDTLYIKRPSDGGSSLIELRDLTIQGGRYGINVAGGFGTDHLVVDMTNIVVMNCEESGIFTIGGDITLDRCVILGNGEYGIQVPGTSSLTIRECIIRDNGAPEVAALPYWQVAGVFATSEASLIVEDSQIQGNHGAGIHIERDVSLVVSSSVISDNTQDGIRLWDAAELHLEDSSVLGNHDVGIRIFTAACAGSEAGESPHLFSGRVTGSGNHIPGPSEPNGNLGGGICPETSAYAFLLDPLP